MKPAKKGPTVRLDWRLQKALRKRAADTDCSVTTFVNNAVKQALAEDAEDLTAIEARRNEPDLDFEDVVRDIKRRGRL